MTSFNVNLTRRISEQTWAFSGLVSYGIETTRYMIDSNTGLPVNATLACGAPGVPGVYTGKLIYIFSSHWIIFPTSCANKFPFLKNNFSHIFLRINLKHFLRIRILINSITCGRIHWIFSSFEFYLGRSMGQQIIKQ